MIPFPYVNAKSKPLMSFYGSQQQDQIARKLAKEAKPSTSARLSKFFIDTSRNTVLNHPFYGKINHLGQPVVTLTEGIFGNLPSPDRPVVCLDYVANAFGESKSIFDNLMSLDPRVAGGCSARDFNSAAGFIKGISENKMRVYRGWQSAGKLHNDHLINEVLPVFLSSYAFPAQAEIESIADFMNLMIDFIRDVGRDCLITFTSFVLSPKNPIYTTGLAFDIMQADANDQQARIEMMNSDGYQNLLTTMNKGGFRSAFRTPWTMVADLSSNAMKKRMKEVGIETPEEMFEEYYIQTYILDQKRLTDFILQAYYTFLSKVSRISKNKYCADGSLDYVSTKVRGDFGKSGKELKQQIDDRLLLQVYLEARVKEAPAQINSTFLNRILNFAHAASKKRGLTEGFKVSNKEMLNLDRRFLSLKKSDFPSYLTSPDSFDNMDEEKRFETGTGGSGIAPGARGYQTGAGGSGIAPGGGSTGGSSGGY